MPESGMRPETSRSHRQGGNAPIVWEAFKVYNGQMHAVEAFMEIMPADTLSGWD